MHYADDGFATVHRDVKWPCERSKTRFCVLVAVLRLATIDNESASNAEINVSRMRRSNGKIFAIESTGARRVNKKK